MALGKAAYNITVRFAANQLIGNAPVSLYPLVKSEASKDKESGVKLDSLCPGCINDGEPKIIKTAYFCEEHGVVPRELVQRGRKTADDTYEIVGTMAETRAAKKSDAEKAVLELHVVPADDVKAVCIPNGLTYAMTASKGNPVIEAIAVSVDADGRFMTDAGVFTLIGECNLVGKPHLFQVRRWGNQLLLMEITRPGDARVVDAVIPEASEKNRAMLGMLVAQMAEEFDPMAFTDASRESFAAWMAERSTAPIGSVTPIKASKDEPVDPDDHLAKMLDALLKAS